jgi:hypothetical protein
MIQIKLRSAPLAVTAVVCDQAAEAAPRLYSQPLVRRRSDLAGVEQQLGEMDGLGAKTVTP